MKKESLASFMLKEHGKIIALLNEFKKNATGNNAKETFNALKEKQDNHVFAEERAIIILNREGRKFEEVVTILRQHSEIHEILTKIKENITFETASFELIKKLLDLMKTHVKLENEKFYPFDGLQFLPGRRGKVRLQPAFEHGPAGDGGKT